MPHTKVKELMESDPAMIAPTATLREAARKMKDMNCGFLPVGEGDTVKGIITDRDIIVRAVSEGKDPAKEKVENYMTANVCACSESDTLADAARAMNENRVSRLVVRNDEGKISGILTFGHIIRANGDREEISEVIEYATADMAA